MNIDEYLNEILEGNARCPPMVLVYHTAKLLHTSILVIRIQKSVKCQHQKARNDPIVLLFSDCSHGKASDSFPEQSYRLCSTEQYGHHAFDQSQTLFCNMDTYDFVFRKSCV